MDSSFQTKTFFWSLSNLSSQTTCFDDLDCKYQVLFGPDENHSTVVHFSVSIAITEIPALNGSVLIHRENLWSVQLPLELFLSYLWSPCLITEQEAAVGKLLAAHKGSSVRRHGLQASLVQNKLSSFKTCIILLLPVCSWHLPKRTEWQWIWCHCREFQDGKNSRSRRSRGYPLVGLHWM